MSEDARETEPAGESLLPKTSPTEPLDSAGLDDVVDEKKALASPDVKAEVKFAAADSQNGDAILDIENVRAAFSGMGKEELMKFANDPFWVRTRWVLFVGFWVLWVAMVAGAIAIIVLAPKCAPPKPRRWWEQSPLYSVESLTPGDKVEGIERYLSSLSKAGADEVILPPLMNTGSSDNPEAVVDFKALRADIGSVEAFKTSLAKLKAGGSRVILEIAPGHTSKEHEWFKQSIQKADKYKDFYIWVNSSLKDSLSPDKWGKDWNQASFVWNDQRGAFYLRQSSADLPVLNLTNPDVIAEYKDILKFWLDQGVSGFQLRHASTFFVNDFINQQKDGTNTNFNQTYTISAAQQLLATVTNHTQDNVLILKGDLPLNPAQTVLIGDVLSLPITLSHLADGFTANQVKEIVEVPVNQSGSKWPLWEITGVAKSTLPPGLVDGLLMTSMLLPGTPVFRDDSLLELSKISTSPSQPVATGGDQQIKSATQHRAEIFKELSSVRKNMVAVSFGSTNITIVNGTDNVSVFTFTRIKSGNPGILVVVNPSSQKTTVDLTELNKVPDELTVNSVSYRTPSEGENPMQLKSKLPANGIKLPEKSAIAFTFVPKKES